MAIMASNYMIGKKWEGNYVHAWEHLPDKYAIENSGARFGVIISFSTSTSFEPDEGIQDPRVKKFNPVYSSRPGPIPVWDVKIVR